MERKLIAAAVSSALVLPMAALAADVSPYGQINRAILSVDDGGADDGDITHADSGASGSRWGLKGGEELENGMNVGFKLEYSLSGSVRHAYGDLSSEAGRITIGHASTAADGMAHADLSGGPSWLGGATPWCAYAGSGPACPTNDGDRRENVRYDTPSIGPAKISISVGNDDYWAAKLAIAGSVGDAGYDLRIGHIGEYDTMVEVAAVPAVPGTPYMPGTPGTPGVEPVPAGQNIERINGADLMALLASENNMETVDGETNANFVIFWDDTNGNDDGIGDPGEEQTAVTLANAQNALDAHLAANEDVVAIDPVGTVTALDADGAALYKTTTTPAVDAVDAVPGTDPTPGTPGVAAVPAMMVPGKAGDITTASASVAFGQGTAVSVAWSQDNLKDHEYQYAKLDHSYGDGSVAVYYKTGEAKGGVDGSFWGVAVGHNVSDGLTAYAGYRQLTNDDPTPDVDLIVAGLRVSFN